ncbi:CDP-glycerol glycerophosphotransferase family protein [Neomegalonema perideroedes]|uniref:CDP-glycerol glycerophosphotransferase family protein n=1 Tax=Neomegalonema perideroedes TaxID=217219 RepID=UPI00035D895A|nr:CDP-glycerol glycerophosphotransferase family protein [Neomegalonema perideroedes]
MRQSRIAFVGWNPFQLNHAAPFIRAIPGAVFLLEKRKDYVERFQSGALEDPTLPVLVHPAEEMEKLDGAFDMIVCQTPFTGVERFAKTTLVSLQYGYAKEPHNYGPWRSLADLALTYGDYACEKISYFSPAVAVGHPRRDDWENPLWRAAARARRAEAADGRKTILYAPTWGELSSAPEFLPVMARLAEDHRLIVKMHHNTDFTEEARRLGLMELQARGATLLGASDDLFEALAAADVFVSDFSGAIFDAVLARKPVVLVGDPAKAALGRKLDAYSLEYARRAELGVVVARPEDLEAGIRMAAERSEEVVAQVSALRARLFLDRPGAGERAAEALRALAEGAWRPSQQQLYMRRDIQELLRARTDLRAMKKAASPSWRFWRSSRKSEAQALR